MLHEMTKNIPSEDIKMYFKTERSFNDEASQAVESDLIRFIIGLIVVYLFVLIMIGGFGWVQQRVNIYNYLFSEKLYTKNDARINRHAHEKHCIKRPSHL